MKKISETLETFQKSAGNASSRNFFNSHVRRYSSGDVAPVWNQVCLKRDCFFSSGLTKVNVRFVFRIRTNAKSVKRNLGSSLDDGIIADHADAAYVTSVRRFASC